MGDRSRWRANKKNWEDKSDKLFLTDAKPVRTTNNPIAKYRWEPATLESYLRCCVTIQEAQPLQIRYNLSFFQFLIWKFNCQTLYLEWNGIVVEEWVYKICRLKNNSINGRRWTNVNCCRDVCLIGGRLKWRSTSLLNRPNTIVVPLNIWSRWTDPGFIYRSILC